MKESSRVTCVERLLHAVCQRSGSDEKFCTQTCSSRTRGHPACDLSQLLQETLDREEDEGGSSHIKKHISHKDGLAAASHGEGLSVVSHRPGLTVVSHRVLRLWPLIVIHKHTTAH